MALDRIDSGLLWAGAGALWASAALSWEFADNVNTVFDSVVNLIDWITSYLPWWDIGTWHILTSLWIETFWALWTAWFSTLITYLLSSNDEKANAVIRSLIIWWVISTSIPVLSAAFIWYLWKKLYDMKPKPAPQRG